MIKTDLEDFKDKVYSLPNKTTEQKIYFEQAKRAYIYFKIYYDLMIKNKKKSVSAE